MLMIIGHYKKADITNKSDIANKKGSVYVHSACNVTLLMSFLINIEKTMPSPRCPAATPSRGTFSIAVPGPPRPA